MRKAKWKHGNNASWNSDRLRYAGSIAKLQIRVSLIVKLPVEEADDLDTMTIPTIRQVSKIGRTLLTIEKSP